MAYFVKYTANFRNEQNQEVTVAIAKKNSSTATVENYKVFSMKITDSSDDQDPYSTIISRTLELAIWTELSNSVNWETFLTDNYDDWKITVYVDGMEYFSGFIIPDEGHAPLQDKPYEVLIKATDGIGLLKGYALTKTDGTNFNGFNTLSQYLFAILYKTSLELPMRTYCGYFYSGMQNKGDGLSKDIFQQLQVNATTFMKDSVEFKSCYDCLKIILGGWCNIQQYNGKWQICTLSELQYVPQDKYYTDYNTNGQPSGGAKDTEGDALVGRNELIYPINENQSIKSIFANKSVRYEFKYLVPELSVSNQKLTNLGSFVSSGSYTVEGQTINYKVYNNVGWTMYKGDPLIPYEQSSSMEHYIRVEENIYAKEYQRYFIVRRDPYEPATLGRNYIKNNNLDFYVSKGDKITISITWRSLNRETANARVYVGRLLLLKDGADGTYQSGWYSLQNSGTTENAGYFVNSFNAFFAETGTTVHNTTEWLTNEIKEAVVPADGTCFLTLGCGNFASGGNEAHIKDIKITITPYLNGTLFTTVGDFHQIEQNNNFPDKDVYEMKISEAPKKFIKGALFYNGQLCNPTFYRFPNTGEVRNFKKLGAYGKFNRTRRRYYKIEGEYRSLVYNISADQNLRKLIGFHKVFTFPDFNPDRRFVLIPPLETDVMAGNIRATFVEVYKDGNDGTQNGDIDKFEYLYS